MNDWLFSFSGNIFPMLLAGLLTYLYLILATRLFGLRSFSKMSGFDFAITIAFGSVLAAVLVSKEPSFIQGATGLTLLFVIQWLIATLRTKSKAFSKVIANQPMLLMDGTTVLHDNLEKCHITEDDLRAKLREANVIELSQVRAVVMEATGDVSVLHSSDDKVQLEDYLLESVARS